MNPQFDDFDKGILHERQSKRFRLNGPQVGDFIKRKDGLFARITHLWDDAVQTNTFNATGEGGSFYLCESGCMSYSGSLEPGLPLTHLKQEHNIALGMKGHAWFFHHGRQDAHNSVHFDVWCKVFRLVDDSEAIDTTKPTRIVAAAEPSQFRGRAQTSTYTTFDGVERAAYSDGKTLKDYLTETIGLKAYSVEEFEAMLDRYHQTLVTEPTEITEEQYNDWLECLPPCRWHDNAGVTFFHISERLTGNLVQWCCRVRGKYYGFTDDASLSKEKLLQKVTPILAA